MTRLYLSLYLTFFFITINAQDYNVLSFNAVGDGKTDDTKAVRAALAAANNSNGGRVIFPSGYTFLTGCFNLTDNVILDVQGTILASLDVKNYEIVPEPPWYGITHTKQPVIFSYNATNLTITGGGVIDGNGPYWYACMYNYTVEPCSPHGRPHLLQPQYSSNIRVENITLKDSPSWTFHLAWTTNVYINNITILSPIGTIISKAVGWNTDGIDIDCSVNVTVENCIINTADDAVVVKSGRDYYGRTYGRRSENIMVRNLNIGYSNGLAIGSEGSAGARNVTFRDSIINGSLHAVDIKTQIGRGGTVEDITFTNISVYNTNVTIELNMCYGGNISSDNGDTSIPTVKNIIITNITADNVEYFWNIEGLNESHVQNVYFSNIYVTNIYKKIVRSCYFIDGICDNSTVTPFCPPCLVQETCFDASNDCSLYVNYCKSPAYHNTLCDLCRKTCGLCQSC